MFFYNQVPLNTPFKKCVAMRPVTKKFQSMFLESHIGLAHSLNLCKDENELLSSSGKQLYRTMDDSGKGKAH